MAAIEVAMAAAITAIAAAMAATIRAAAIVDPRAPISLSGEGENLRSAACGSNQLSWQDSRRRGDVAAISARDLHAIARFAITVVLLLALALWNLPEFQKWGRHDRNSQALAPIEQECEYQAQKVAARNGRDNDLETLRRCSR